MAGGQFCPDSLGGGDEVLYTKNDAAKTVFVPFRCFRSITQLQLETPFESFGVRRSRDSLAVFRSNLTRTSWRRWIWRTSEQSITFPEGPELGVDAFCLPVGSGPFRVKVRFWLRRHTFIEQLIKNVNCRARRDALGPAFGGGRGEERGGAQREILSFVQPPNFWQSLKGGNCIDGDAVIG